MKLKLATMSAAALAWALTACGSDDGPAKASPSDNFATVQDLGKALTESGIPCVAADTESNAKAAHGKCQIPVESGGAELNLSIYTSEGDPEAGLQAYMDYTETASRISVSTGNAPTPEYYVHQSNWIVYTDSEPAATDVKRKFGGELNAAG